MKLTKKAIEWLIKVDGVANDVNLCSYCKHQNIPMDNVSIGAGGIGNCKMYSLLDHVKTSRVPGSFSEIRVRSCKNFKFKS